MSWSVPGPLGLSRRLTVPPVVGWLKLVISSGPEEALSLARTST